MPLDAPRPDGTHPPLSDMHDEQPSVSLTDRATSDRISAVRDDATRELREAQDALARATRRERFWSHLQDVLKAGLVAAAVQEIERALKRAPGPATELTADERAWLVTYLEQLRTNAMTAMLSLPRDLADELVRLGLQLDASARHPRYSLSGGFLVIDVDERRLVATVRARDGQPVRVGADASAIASTVKKIHDRLFRADRPVLNRQMLVAAYERVLHEDGLAPGADVPITRVRAALRLPKGAKLGGDEFNVDLATLLRSPPADASRVAVANTRQTEKGMLLHGMEAVGYVGYLRIEASRQ